MAKIKPHPISQEFIREAEEQLKKTQKLYSNYQKNQEKTQKDYNKILEAFDKIEDSLKCALYIGNNNVYYNLVRIYDIKFEVLPKYKEDNVSLQKSRDAMVIAGRKLGITKCLKTETISNQIINDNDITNLIEVVIKVQKHFSNKTLTKCPKTKEEILDYYHKTFTEISDNFSPLTILNLSSCSEEDFKNFNTHNPIKAKPTSIHRQGNKTIEIYANEQNINDEISLSGYSYIVNLINYYFDDFFSM